MLCNNSCINVKSLQIDITAQKSIQINRIYDITIFAYRYWKQAEYMPIFAHYQSHRIHSWTVINIRAIVFTVRAVAVKATIYLYWGNEQHIIRLFLCVHCTHLNGGIISLNCDVDRISTTNNYNLYLWYMYCLG